MGYNYSFNVHISPLKSTLIANSSNKSYGNTVICFSPCFPTIKGARKLVHEHKKSWSQARRNTRSRWKEVVSQLDEATVISLVRMRKRSNYVYSSQWEQTGREWTRNEWNGVARMWGGGRICATYYTEKLKRGNGKSEMHIPRQHKAPLVVAAQGFPKGLDWSHQGSQGSGIKCIPKSLRNGAIRIVWSWSGSWRTLKTLLWP